MVLILQPYTYTYTYIHTYIYIEENEMRGVGGNGLKPKLWKKMPWFKNKFKWVLSPFNIYFKSKLLLLWLIVVIIQILRPPYHTFLLRLLSNGP